MAMLDSDFKEETELDDLGEVLMEGSDAVTCCAAVRVGGILMTGGD